MPNKVKSLARGVSLAGVGMSKFGAFAEKSSRDIFTEAYLNMQQSLEFRCNPSEIDAIYIGNFSSDLFEHQGHTAPLMADAVGLVPRPATRVENACASGSAAFRQGVFAIASGMADVVLVGGVEKMTGLPTSEVTDALATAGDMLYEIPAGFTFPGFYAAMASAYMHAYGMVPEHLMNVAIKNHENGSRNPLAQFNVTIAAWMESRKQAAEKKGKPIPSWSNVWDFLHDESANPLIAWPLRLFDCSPITDGAAVVLLVSEERASEFTRTPIRIAATSQASDAPMHDRLSLTSLPAARKAAFDAYQMAGITPNDIRIAEVHDCFTIAEIIATEDLGFFDPGDGYKMAEDGVTALDGRQPINTSGGLKSKGHPVGASGVAQIVEIWEQMHGEAGDRQVKGEIHWGLTHNVGATGNTCIIHIFENN